LSALRPSDLPLSHKGLFLVSVPLIIGLLFIAMLSYVLEKSRQELDSSWRKYQTVSAIERLTSLGFDASQTIFFYAKTREPSAGASFDAMIAEMPQQYKIALAANAGDEKTTAALRRMQQLSDRGMDILKLAKRDIDLGDRQALMLNIGGMKERFQSCIGEFHLKAQDLLQSLAKSQTSSPTDVSDKWGNTLRGFLICGVIVEILISFTLAVYFSRSIGMRLRVTTDNALRLAKGDSLNPPLPGRDEMAALDGVFHDMAAQLEETARKERAIIENAVDVICSIDRRNKFTAVNPASFKIWGYSPEELIGNSLLNILPDENRDETVLATKTAIESRAQSSFESCIKRKDGKIIETVWSAHWSPTEETLFCVSHDITQRKVAETLLRESEARLRLIMESMPVALIVVNEAGCMELANATAEKMFGYDYDHLISLPFASLFPELKKEGQDALGELLDKGPGKTTDLNAIKLSGESFPVELSFSEFETREGLRRLAIILDVTERQEVERLKHEFFAMVSHDLRSPLTSLQATLSLFQMGAYGEVNERGRLSLSRADSEITRLIALINDLLDSERLSSGKFDVHLDSVDVADVLSSSVSAIKRMAEQRHIAIDIQPTEARATADGARLIQVLVNLLSNAIKFSPNDSTITISTVASSSALEIRVTDQGRGVSEAHKRLIFERYRQVEVADATKKGGAGLGLAICKAIIEQHGGTIGLDSEEGKGSTFWFRIPACNTDPNDLTIEELKTTT